MVMSMTPIEIIVTPQGEALQGNDFYQSHDADGRRLCGDVREVMLDLIPFIVARLLLDWNYYDLETLFIVRLQGSDSVMMRAPLGAVAATPLPNTANPIRHPSYNAWLEFTAS